MIVEIILKLIFIILGLAIVTPWVMFVTTVLGTTQFPSKREENKTWFWIWIGLGLIYIGYPILIFLL